MGQSGITHRGRRSRVATPLAIALAVLCTGVVQAAAQAPFVDPGPPANSCPRAQARPCIGLVLGGGAARGGAHIGVLEALEELRIPVDLIAGTSIGAIVGGLYATGLDASEIRSLAEGLVWEEILSGAPARGDRAYRRKQDDPLFPVALELGVGGDGLRLPRGFIPGHSLNTLLSQAAVPVRHVADFGGLPIPFRPVVADLATGRAVALTRGDLGRAIRASMSVPGAFPPVQIGDRLYADGGIGLNLPVAVAQAMGAEVVIAVDVATPPHPVEDLTTAVAISQQALRFPLRRGTEAQLALLGPQDLALAPDLAEIRWTDFRQLAATIDRGAEAVRARLPDLARLQESEETYAAWRTEVRQRRRPLPHISAVTLDNPTRLADRLILGQLEPSVGAPLDPARLREALAGLHGLGFFEAITYRVVPDPSRQTGTLHVSVVPDPLGPHRLRFGVSFLDDLGGRSSFGFATGLTLGRLNGWGGELRNHLQLGQIRRLFSEWYQPLGGGGRFFVAPRVAYTRDLGDVYTGDVRTAELRRTTTTAGLHVGARLGTVGEVRLGLDRGRVELDTRTGPVDSTRIRADLGSLSAQIAVDQLNDRRFPEHGAAWRLEARHSTPRLGATATYTRASASGVRALPFGSGTVVGLFEAGTAFGDTLPMWDRFELGGLFRISGMRPRQRTGSHLALGSLLYMRPLAVLPTTLSGGRLLLGLSVESGGAWDDLDEVSLDGLRLGASAFVGLETFLGPLRLGYGRADGGHGTWTFTLGRTF